MPVITTGFTKTLTVKAKVDQNTTNLTMNLTYGAGLAYVAASAVPSAGTMNVGGTQWVIPVVTANTEYTMSFDVEVTDEALFSAGTRIVEAEIVALAGEVYTADNIVPLPVTGDSCADLANCFTEYEIYFEQTGTNDPVVTEVYNSLNETPTFTRGSQGVYTVQTVANIFPAAKTMIHATISSSTVTSIQAQRFFDNMIVVSTLNDAGVLTDLAGSAFLTIKVRN
jgi:hypothetical protein